MCSIVVVSIIIIFMFYILNLVDPNPVWKLDEWLKEQLNLTRDKILRSVGFGKNRDLSVVVFGGAEMDGVCSSMWGVGHQLDKCCFGWRL